MEHFLGLFKAGMLEKYLGIFIAIIITVILVKIIGKILSLTFQRIEGRTPNAESKKQLKTLEAVIASTVKALLYTLLAFHILAALGFDIRPLIATAGVLGVAIGFGAKRFVEDIISGFLIILEGQARVGDVVSINGIEGTVEKVNLKMITLRGADGTLNFIRNGLIDVISNKTRDYSVATFEVGVGYKENITKIIDILKNLGEQLQNDEAYGSVIIEPLEVLGIDRFADNSIIIKCQIKTQPAKLLPVQRRFNLLVKEKFDELGIAMPTRQFQ